MHSNLRRLCIGVALAGATALYGAAAAAQPFVRNGVGVGYGSFGAYGSAPIGGGPTSVPAYGGVYGPGMGGSWNLYQGPAMGGSWGGYQGPAMGGSWNLYQGPGMGGTWSGFQGPGMGGSWSGFR